MESRMYKGTSGLPVDIPAWSSGTGFGAEKPLHAKDFSLVRVTTFHEVWDNGTAWYFNAVGLPQGYYSLGSYGETHSEPPFGGWVLAIAGSFDGDSPALKHPTEYDLIWSSDKVELPNQSSTSTRTTTAAPTAYFWAPQVPEGYKALGTVITNSEEEPGPQEIVLVREDLTEPAKRDALVWSTAGLPGIFSFSTYTTKPGSVGHGELGIPFNGVYCSPGLEADEESFPVTCLKNVGRVLDLMPTLAQLKEIMAAYGPTVTFHPQELYMPATPQWYFDNGGMLYSKANPESPVKVEKGGANLPTGGCNDREHWLDFAESSSRETLLKGDLSSAKVQVLAKPMYGGILTDVSCWLFYCFNGSGTARLGMVVKALSLGRIGEHVCDWEHFVLRVDNFTGELRRIYLAAHSGGKWVRPCNLEFARGNRAVVYSSRNGHAMYPDVGEHLQGGSAKIGVGMRNDTGKGPTLDTSLKYEFMNVDYLGEKGEPGYPEQPAWVDFMRQWGPTVKYDRKTELERIISYLPSMVRKGVMELVGKLPLELGGEEGPTGPKEKGSWAGNERY